LIIHVNNGKGQFYVVKADGCGEAIRMVNAKHLGFGGYYCDIVTPGGGYGGVGKWFDKIGGPYSYTPEAKGIRHNNREN
jgi:hypothetical protein